MCSSDLDGRLPWGEVRRRWPDIWALMAGHLRLSVAGQDCQPAADAPAVPEAGLTTHTDGRYAVMSWRVQCPQPAGMAWRGVDVDYRLFALDDPTHRGIVRWRQEAPQAQASLGVVVLGAQQATRHLAWPAWPEAATPAEPVTAPGTASAAPVAAVVTDGGAPTEAPRATPPSVADSPTRWQTLLDMTREGVHHIAEGTDHLLFLLSLLLVAVWRRPSPRAGWTPHAQARQVWREVLSLVTAFTVAHSITLAVAAYGWWVPPSRWVESLIALSVLLAALDNLVPVLPARRWVVVFGFGLVHGFGFAGAMQDLGLSRADLAWPLFGFNLGVELGQLVVVACVMPLAIWARQIGRAHV